MQDIDEIVICYINLAVDSEDNGHIIVQVVNINIGVH